MASEASHQHFALFIDAAFPGSFYVGFKDYVGTTGFEKLGDYNDMVIKITPVPLPGALVLLGVGMVRLLAYSRPRRETAALMIP